MTYIPTSVIYQTNSEYVQERRDLHNLIIKKNTESSVSKTPSSAVLSAGGSASGKTFFIEKYFLSSTEENYVLIDSDNIKNELPEYIAEIENKNLDAADIVHEESGHIANSLLDFCIKNNYSFIYDGTMSNLEKYTTLLKKLKKANFMISALYVDIDIDIALERAAIRAFQTGRAVSEIKIRETNLQSAKTFYALISQFDEAVLFNNSKKLGTSEIPFAQKEIHKLKPINFDEYQLFIKKVES
ncbi:zeta toxin family protein [Solibacillus sp. A46]|uniref:UDP-N-acetylglucosamine kinase n=1 Tax=Solibacillus faecavium TaxID=2762221 RepID=A0ABR8XXR1_9BACL|nr:zeta toxin family protein [Solibacillus faecavium]MBD8036624.1 zeta toxin family protein [Solibacillus faecavium]